MGISIIRCKHISRNTPALVVLLCLALNTTAQTTDTTLNEFKVSTKHKISADDKLNSFAPGQKVHTIDSATLRQYQQQSMADLLGQQLPVFIKSYGVNSAATLSFRGSSAAQSQVLWNGVPIQNAVLGLADISTLPVLMVNKVNVVYGGSSALWGSGNVGGAVLLESNAPVFDTGHTSSFASGGGGSFGQYTIALGHVIALPRWYLSATAYTQAATNKFGYTDASGAYRTMPNAHLVSNGAMARLAYKIDLRQTVSLTTWYQQYNREIPPALFEASSVKQQQNASLRLLATWERRTYSNSWYAKSSIIKDDIDYNDDALMLHTSSSAWQYYQELGWKKRWNEQNQLLLFMPVQLLWMNEPISTTLRQQHRLAIAAAYNYRQFGNRLDVGLSARAEAIDDQRILLPGASASFALRPWLSLRANAQRTYRAPTLNELYYNPGGNPGLKPEQGWNEDAGYAVRLRLKRFSLYHDLSIYNRNIHDWIIWLGGAIWTPHNIALVHSRGVETDNKVSFDIGKWQFHIGLNTAYVLSTTTSSYIQNDGSEGKQIPYTPRYNGRLNAGFSYRQLSFTYIHSYTGYRFITSDESDYLLPYQMGNVQLAYSLSKLRNYVQFTAQCNNIWNERYSVAGYRPMPGINWLAGIRLGIN